MDFPDYIDPSTGKVWTHYHIMIQKGRRVKTTDEERQSILDAMAKKEGWAVYVQPDPYQERMEN